MTIVDTSLYKILLIVARKWSSSYQVSPRHAFIINLLPWIWATINLIVASSSTLLLHNQLVVTSASFIIHGNLFIKSIKQELKKKKRNQVSYASNCLHCSTGPHHHAAVICALLLFGTSPLVPLPLATPLWALPFSRVVPLVSVGSGDISRGLVGRELSALPLSAVCFFVSML